MASDITIVYLTSNKLPIKWQEFHQEHIRKLNLPVISVSQKPMDLGINLIQDQLPSKPNIFYQLMRGIRLVNTKYVAVVEDDCLYTKEHFTEFRPKDDEFAYNAHRWSWYAWKPEIYSLKNFIRTGASLIAPTKLALDLLEERFAKYPMGSEMPLGMCGELGVYEKELGLKQRRVIDFKSTTPILQTDHDFFTVLDPKKETIERRHRKKLGIIQCYDIPIWGKAIDLKKYFNEE